MKQKKLVPKRRFEEFIDSWEIIELEKVLHVNSGRDYKHLNKGNVPVYGTGGLMLYVDDKLSNVDGIGIGRKGTIDKPQYLKAPFWTVDTLFFMTPIFKSDIYFLYLKSQTIDWKEMDESTSVPSLSKDTIGRVQLCMPKHNEQQKIGQFFKHLDEMIALEQRKIDKTLSLKAAYLAEMFPAEGERVPKRRFAGFTQSWTEVKLEDIADIVSGGTPSTNNPQYWNGDIDWYTPTEIGKQIYAKKSLKTITKLGLEKSSAKVLPPNRTILFTSRAGIGDMAILKKHGTTNQGFQSIVLREDIDIYFIYSMGFLIKEYAVKNASGSTFLEISGKPLGNMQLLLPSSREQIKIGSFFKKLDDTIMKHQQKLEKLKATKQAYLNEMFV